MFSVRSVVNLKKNFYHGIHGVTRNKTNKSGVLIAASVSISELSKIRYYIKDNGIIHIYNIFYGYPLEAFNNASRIAPAVRQRFSTSFDKAVSMTAAT